MGNRSCIQHVETGLFLDCNGNSNKAVPILCGYKNKRDQWWQIKENSDDTVSVRADHHPNRRLVANADGSVILVHPARSTRWTVKKHEGGFVQLQCDAGYLTKLTTQTAAGAVVGCTPQGNLKSTIWCVIPKEDGRTVNNTMASSLSFVTRLNEKGEPQGRPHKINTRELEKVKNIDPMLQSPSQVLWCEMTEEMWEDGTPQQPGKNGEITWIPKALSTDIDSSSDDEPAQLRHVDTGASDSFRTALDESCISRADPSSDNVKQQHGRETRKNPPTEPPRPKSRGDADERRAQERVQTALQRAASVAAPAEAPRHTTRPLPRPASAQSKEVMATSTISRPTTPPATPPATPPPVPAQSGSRPASPAPATTTHSSRSSSPAPSSQGGSRAASPAPANGNNQYPTGEQRLTMLKGTVVSSSSKEPQVTDYSKPPEQFTVYEGATQVETITFRVNAPLRNLRKINVTYKMGIPVKTTTTDLGSYEPREEPYEFTFPKAEIPHSKFLMPVSGNYSNSAEFVDDSGRCCPIRNQKFTISKK